MGYKRQVLGPFLLLPACPMASALCRNLKIFACAFLA